jgi:hypothetical protein
MEPAWDKTEAQKLRDILGPNDQEAIGLILGRIAEHRQQSDREGYKRGYNAGFANAYRKYTVEGK